MTKDQKFNPLSTKVDRYGRNVDKEAVKKEMNRYYKEEDDS